MLNTSFAVFSSITLSTSTGGNSSTSPVLESMVFFTTRGFILTPLLAMADTAVTICSGVTSNLCPKLIVASSTGPTFFSFRKIPFASPGRLIFVLSKNPNFLKYS